MKLQRLSSLFLQQGNVDKNLPPKNTFRDYYKGMDGGPTNQAEWRDKEHSFVDSMARSCDKQPRNISWGILLWCAETGGDVGGGGGGKGRCEGRGGKGEEGERKAKKGRVRGRERGGGNEEWEETTAE